MNKNTIMTRIAAMRTITVKTLEDTQFTIKYDSGADLCWSCAFPNRFDGHIQAAGKFNDEFETLADGYIIWHAGSLDRILSYIADYISASEA